MIGWSRYSPPETLLFRAECLCFGELAGLLRGREPETLFCPRCVCGQGLRSASAKIFKIWQEGKVPHFVLETTSSSTRREDKVKKKELYEKLKIPEYFLYDPLAEWLKPPLQVT